MLKLFNFVTQQGRPESLGASSQTWTGILLRPEAH